MKKYNVQNYVRYKNDLKRSMPGDKIAYSYYTRDELIIKFMPLVENLARKFSTSDQASGVLSINDLIQEGNAGLVQAVNNLKIDTITESADPEKTIKSFLAKRIKGAIRRAIDINRGNIRIPEYKITEIRKDEGKDKKLVSMFFNQIFTSIDENFNSDDDYDPFEVADTSEPYNIQLLNTYLLSIMEKYLSVKQYEVLRLSYGLDCEKLSAKEIANLLDISGVSNYVRVSEIKKAAIEKLIDETPANNVIDYL
ncbi:MAG: sigma-70 family RNA polymerase sigma factor [Clostridium sp.]|jgi:RNA polymerase sigma factor (sigma-70 family)|tara:strand:- start:14 stop:772 length:759 start_codon:yes stop_codon:yes gene_type:complete